MVTPIKKGTKRCSRKTSSKPPPSSSTLDASAVQNVSSYLTLKQVSLTIALTLGGSWNTTLTEFLTNNKQQKGNNKHAQTNHRRPLLVAVLPLQCVQLLPLLRHGGMGRGKPR
ncbi:MAG: hypothetical protein J6R59_01350 [Paludibacteraceae bacterium]|nr:hypothetical protein [Paludibacteraceae bacterium]